MKKKLSWYVVGLLILGLVLLTVSCGGTTTAPAVEKEPAVEEPAAEEPAVEEPAVEEAAAEAPTATTHTLEGRDNCLMCHSSGALAVPDDHAGRTNETCTLCHQPTE